MREIKFRAWVPNLASDKKMIYGKAIAVDGSGKAFWVGHDNYPLGDSDVLMQFTGLKDKNGKEIFEGDIVHNTHGGPYAFRDMIVCWHQYHMGFALATKPENIGDWAIKMENGPQGYEIIGNIYEHPELVKS